MALTIASVGTLASSLKGNKNKKLALDDAQSQIGAHRDGLDNEDMKTYIGVEKYDSPEIKQVKEADHAPVVLRSVIKTKPIEAPLSPGKPPRPGEPPTGDPRTGESPTGGPRTGEPPRPRPTSRLPALPPPISFLPGRRRRGGGGTAPSGGGGVDQNYEDDASDEEDNESSAQEEERDAEEAQRQTELAAEIFHKYWYCTTNIADHQNNVSQARALADGTDKTVADVALNALNQYLIKWKIYEPELTFIQAWKPVQLDEGKFLDLVEVRVAQEKTRQSTLAGKVFWTYINFK